MLSRCDDSWMKNTTQSSLFRYAAMFVSVFGFRFLFRILYSNSFVISYAPLAHTLCFFIWHFVFFFCHLQTICIIYSEYGLHIAISSLFFVLHIRVLFYILLNYKRNHQFEISRHNLFIVNISISIHFSALYIPVAVAIKPHRIPPRGK